MNRRRILKYLRGDTTMEDRINMLHWLQEDPSHMEEYRYLRNIFDATLCEEEDIPIPSNLTGGVIVHRRIGYAVAAAVILLLCVGLSFWTLGHFRGESSSVAMNSIYVPMGQRTEITLNDQTKIWLNSNTHIYIDEHEKRFRQVYLDGEAYFEVTPNKELPFIVKTKEYDIRVLGTKFNVTAYKSHKDFSVRLYEGSVAIDEGSSNFSFRLSPNEEARIVNGRLSKTAFRNEESLLWIDGIYYFENADYSNIFKRLEEYYKVDIKVVNPKVYSFKCTCKFRQEDGLKHILESLSQIHSFDYQWSDDDKTVIIK